RQDTPMTSPYPNEPISPLRARMIEDMRVRNFVAGTQGDYIRAVKKLAAFVGRSPDTATAEELRAFQQHLAAGLANPHALTIRVRDNERNNQLTRLRSTDFLMSARSMKWSACRLSSSVSSRPQAPPRQDAGSRLYYR
ncbi:MAG: phage integrase N-terminal SAM-like domain-containing protein, partial [Hyphomicrobium sp.]